MHNSVTCHFVKYMHVLAFQLNEILAIIYPSGIQKKNKVPSLSIIVHKIANSSCQILFDVMLSCITKHCPVEEWSFERWRHGWTLVICRNYSYNY